MTKLYMVGIAPMSWRIGVIRRTETKIVTALGPLRVAVHTVLA